MQFLVTSDSQGFTFLVRNQGKKIKKRHTFFHERNNEKNNLLDFFFNSCILTLKKYLSIFKINFKSLISKMTSKRIIQNCLFDSETLQ